MESRKVSALKAGVFVVVGTVVLMISILLLGGDQMFFRPSYELTVNLEEVQGLSKGSVVALAGYPIGNVSSLEFLHSTNKLKVHLDLDRDFQNRITDKALASVKTQGALGDKYIFIDPGDFKTGTPLRDGDEITASQEPDLIDVISEKGKDLGNAIEVVNETYTLLKAINQNGRSALLMQNMVEASSEMNFLFKESRAMVKEIRKKADKDAKLTQALTHLTSVLEKVDQGEGTLGALVNDPTLHDKLITVLGAAPRNKFLKPIIRDTIKVNEDNSSSP